MRNTFKDLTFEELVTKREVIRGQYRKMRFEVVIGNVENRIQKRILRRKLACLNTIIYNHPEIVTAGQSSTVTGDKA